MKNRSNPLKRIFSALDFFGEDVGFTINGQRTHKSAVGFLLSLGIMLTVLAFGLKKFVLCWEF